MVLLNAEAAGSRKGGRGNSATDVALLPMDWSGAMTIATGDVTANDVAWQVLREAHSEVQQGLRAAVERLAEPTRTVAGYHFGWWDEHRQATSGDAGKAVRPALVRLCAQAVGASPQRALSAAVAVELAHNFTLLHDDIMDADVLRRHRRTAWSVFGVPAGILAGDALLVLALEVLAVGDPARAAVSVRWLCEALLKVVAGQEADMAFERRDAVSVDECLAMASDKTAALLSCACALGALLGGGSPARVELLRRFGHHLGLAFQLVDDLLGIWGDPEVTGKPRYSDLRATKKSLPVVAALTAGTDVSDRFARLYLRPDPLSDAELDVAAALIEQAGGRRWAYDEAGRQLGTALSCLDAAEPAPQAASHLVALAGLITHRDR